MKEKLTLKIQNQVSDYESIENIDSLIDAAVTEAHDLIKNKDVSQTIEFDIAYFRFLLFVRQDEITELEYKMYDKNISIVEKSPVKQNTPDNEEPRSSFSKVATRRTF